MKKITFIISLFLLAKFTLAQKFVVDTAVKIAIEQQGKKAGEALLKKDYKTFLKYTYPTILAMGGGQDKVAAAIKAAMENVAKQGYHFNFSTYRASRRNNSL